MISPVQQRLLRLLADGELHSGTALGERVGISRAAVWKQIQSLQAEGIEVVAELRHGYRLPAAVSLLDAEDILEQLEGSIRERLPSVQALWQCDSTNSELMRQLHQGAEPGSVLLAEYQSGGRGRRGKSWISPFGSSLNLSLLWRFSGGVMALSGLGMVVGIAMAHAVQAVGIEGAMLKWPNDLHLGDHKLGGVLIELEGESEGPTDIVIGVGINVALSAQAGGVIDQPWTSLSHYLNPTPTRNQLAAALLNQLTPRLDRFEQSGLAALMPEWEALDRVRGSTVVLQQESGATIGVARGINALGALQLECEGAIQSHYSGDLSLRLHPSG
ncbi:MAG: bifunctional biotin--[acetyl-CoA-carboxylase] ligase/biotin operon repressor BirA [Gammaproteobacteria bacterium]|nr:bifunctional biotin--[acetyl-CoA-carboxylase] ligase/biotin operon repressor BirA [Gammaproteobacteria bacterium]